MVLSKGDRSDVLRSGPYNSNGQDEREARSMARGRRPCCALAAARGGSSLILADCGGGIARRRPGSMRLASLPVSILLLAVSLAAGCQSSASTEAVFADGAQLEVLADGMGFVEGPVWLESEQRLVFSDIPERKLRSWSRQDGLSLYRESPHPNGNMLDEEGRLLTCRHGERDLVRTEADGSLTVLATGWNGRRFNSPNDLSVRADGTIWFTDPPWGLPRQREGRELDWNGVYRLDPSTGEVVLLSKEHTMPNGIGLSPDGQTLYLADTGGHPSHPDPARHELPAVVTAYPILADGSLGAPRWQTPTRCDGMAIDRQGRIYTTSREGIVVLDPTDGRILTTLPMPESPANCTFGESDGMTLFITARTSLYAIRTAVPGARSR